MILKTLKLENIRSYVDQTINFPIGTTLFEGDIGSGKSTILMAIEFALFGLGSEKGGALLRVGAKKGSVTLKFEVDGEEYEVYRSLERKGKGVQQGECYLITKEGKKHLSPSEVKEKILDIINFNEPPDPKAQSVIYRYTIFTPQEEMKAILLMKPDLRLQTLRKAFRIEDYRISAENASNLVSIIRTRAIELDVHASDLEVKKEACKKMEGEIESYKEKLTSSTKTKIELEEKEKKLKEEISQLQEKKDKLGRAVGEVPLLAKQIEEKKEEVSTLQNEIAMFIKEINEKIQPELDKLAPRRPVAKTEDELELELKDLRNKEKELGKTEAMIEAKITDYSSILKNKVCPTCDRPASPEEFMQKITQKNEEKNKVYAQIKACEEKIKETEKLLNSLREYEKAQLQISSLREQINERNKRIEKNQSRINELNQQIEQKEKQLEKAKKDVAEYGQILEKLNLLQKQLDSVNAELTSAISTISETKKAIEMLGKNVEEIKKEIKIKEAEKKTAEKLKEYQIWLEQFFIPTLDTIEKHVMLSINQEFNQHFQKWWSLLVEDSTKEARIDEDFTPLIEQDGYEHDISYLSGGEKTSLALAYRLALNSVVQRVSTSMKSNLLILDEPTDGFSKEQLFKIREILNEIKCSQIIIVSHEKELESFADHVINVEKKEGVSQVMVR